MTIRLMAPAGALAVLVTSIALAAIPQGSELDCLIEAHVTITLSTPANGLIETVSVDRGDIVKEGQVLATLDSSVERATGAVSHAQAELTNKRLAALEVQRSSAELALRTVVSPVNGVVVERFMHPGEFAKQDKIFKLAQIDPLRVEVFVPVSMFGQVSVGQEAQVRPEAPVGGTHLAKVTVVDRVVDAASGMYGVRLALPNPDLKLPAGLKCRIRFLKK